MSYEVFDPPRRIEDYPGRVPLEVVEETARCRLQRQPPKYLVKGEWSRPDGSLELDIAINRAWVVAISDHQLIDGRIRYVCPSCGKFSGSHAKGCGF